MKLKLLSSSIVVLVVLGFSSYIFVPTLEAIPVGNSIQIKTLSLGEYYTSIETLEFYENNKKIITFKAINEKSKMHTVTVNTGFNTFKDMYLEGYKINYHGQSSYKFKNGITYRVKAKWSYFSKEVEFLTGK